MKVQIVILLALVVIASCQFSSNRKSHRRQQGPFSFGFPPKFQSGGFPGQGFSGQGFSQPQPKPSFGTQVHSRNGNSVYHHSWELGKNELSGSEADTYCRGLGGGWNAVAISSGREQRHIYGILTQEGQRYTWTSGRKHGNSWRWGNGEPFSIQDWSSRGANGGPQPDNREGNENCLGVLNNVYRDGVKFHDIGCSHKKPVICEKHV